MTLLLLSEREDARLKKSAVETYKDRKRSARSFNIHHEVGIRNSPAAAGVGLPRGAVRG